MHPGMDETGVDDPARPKAVSKSSLLMSETLNRCGATAIRSPGVEVPIGRWMLWAKKAGLAVLDQGLFTGSHFIINVLLARWLEPAQYGAFAVRTRCFCSSAPSTPRS
jgi:hypothetical protein